MLEGKKRILVIGCSGSGKSTLALTLGDLIGVPVVHLDRHFWRPGWVPTPSVEWLSRLEALLEKPSWIMDGDYNSSLELRTGFADAIVFLDLPRFVCLYRVLKRILKNVGRTRADLPDDCPEKVDMEFLRWVWSWHRMIRPRVLGCLDAPRSNLEVITLSSLEDIRRFEEGLQ